MKLNWFCRRESGKKAQETLEQIAAKKAENERKQEQKEKAEAAKYAAQIKEQVRLEQEARKKTGEGTAAPPNTQPPTVPLAKLSVSGGRSSDASTTTLRLRLFNGETQVEQFESSKTLNEVAEAVSKKYNITVKFHFRQNFPNVLFKDEDGTKTLKELGLVPNAALVLTTTLTTGGGPVNEPQVGYVQAAWNYLSSWLWWFLGTAPANNTNNNATQPSAGSLGFAKRGSVNHVHSETEYNNCLNTSDLVVVDFSAAWCGPCKAIAPFFEELAAKNPGVVFVHVDIDKLKSVSSGVGAVPTFKFFKGRRQVAVIQGANRDELNSTVNRFK